MESPSSSNSSSSSQAPELQLQLKSIEKCQICEQKAHGKHFGAVTCRACAAFFRRVGALNSIKPCKKSNKCTFQISGFFNCKQCRLEKCKSMGMTIENFQYYREASTTYNTLKIPNTINHLLGETSLIIISSSTSNKNSKRINFINMELLLERAKSVLNLGLESPLLNQDSRSLSRLALGLQRSRGNSVNYPKAMMKIGKEEMLAVWQKDLLKVAKWLTYFDDFRLLSEELQLTILKSVWHVWCRLDHIARTAIGRRRNECGFNQMMMNFGDQNYIADMATMKIDVSWCSDYPIEQLRFFLPNDPSRSETMVKMLLDTEPTDEELSYLLCQVCFHFVKKKHSGEIVEVMERFEEKVADDLHDYYVNELRMPRYCGRLAKLMKINNELYEALYQEKLRKELAVLFNVFNVKFSHPEMFKNRWGSDD